MGSLGAEVMRRPGKIVQRFSRLFTHHRITQSPGHHVPLHCHPLARFAQICYDAEVIRRIRSGVVISLGVFFLLLGVIGGFLPVIQGWIFVLIGLALLAEEVPWVRRHLERLKTRFPKQSKQLDRLITRFTSRRTTTRPANQHPDSAPK